MTATKSAVIPTLCYRDAEGAIAFLEKAFGFKRRLVVPGEGGTVAHAQLTFESGMVMLHSETSHGEYGQLVRPPPSRHSAITGGLYVVVKDVDAHCARAEAAGAIVIIPPKDQDYGGRDYTCRDLEGYVWSFGSYDPWVQPVQT